MADTDLIACLYASGAGLASAAVEAEANNSRYVGPSLSTPQQQQHRTSRHSTEEPGPGSHWDLKHLELRFSHGPQTSHGFVFGSDPNSDIVLPSKIGISYHHFALTFDECKRLIVQDLGSLLGTQVTYNNEGGGKRRDFTWIVESREVPREKVNIVIEVNEALTFQIVVCEHDRTSPVYIDNVNQFRRGAANAENLFAGLGIPPETERPTGAQTPMTGRIYLKKRLGQGSFGEVTHLWNVSTGREYALKQPSAQAIREKRVRLSAWREEARVMGQISQGRHPHIVRLLRQDFSTSSPRLYLEYVPGGALCSWDDVSSEECTQILRQLLSALEYLHGLKPPVLHRDIKSSNILVQYRHDGEIYVKFGDFGLSKEERESGDWSTVCGTFIYTAPEMHAKRNSTKSGGKDKKKYTAAVDIWSLGVVVFELLCDLPHYKESYRDRGIVWCEKIVSKFQKELNKRPGELKEFLLDRMVVIDPKLRGSARDCHKEVLLLSSATEDRCQTPTPASYANGQQIMPLDHAGDYVDEGPQAIQLEDTGDSDTIDSTEIRRYIRSGSPGPSSHFPAPVVAGKRESRTSKSSSDGRSTKRSRCGSLPAGPSSHGQPDEFDSELEQFYQQAGQDPLDPLCVGSSLAGLGQITQSGSVADYFDDSGPAPQDDSLSQPNWGPPQDIPGPDPRLVGGGLVYTNEPVQAQAWAGRSWGNGGRSWGNGGRSWGNDGRSWGEEHAVEGVPDNDQEATARMLLHLREG